MNPNECPQINICPLVNMVLDKDLAGDWQYAQAIRDVCSKCEGAKTEITGIMQVREGEGCRCEQFDQECLNFPSSIEITTDDGRTLWPEDLPTRARITIQEL